MLDADDLAVMRAEQEAEMTLTVTVKRPAAPGESNALGTWSDTPVTMGTYKCRVATNTPRPYDAGGKLDWASSPILTTEWNADVEPGDILEISDGRVYTAIGATNRTETDVTALQVACEE